MKGPIREAFLREKYESLFAKLTSYRLDPYIKKLDASQEKNPGKVFPFARGLRFSSLLIYTIRKNLQHQSLTANWGQIINEDGMLLSNECDIIIHTTRNNDEERWNGDGHGNNIMDFRFIDEKDVKVVVSCKSFITSSTVEIDYYQNLRNFVSRIWLFAECCGPRSSVSIETNAKSTGYEHFFYLYTYNKVNDKTTQKFNEWKRFITEVQNIMP